VGRTLTRGDITKEEMRISILSKRIQSERAECQKKRKEVTEMTYKKPELIVLGNSLETIQGSPKGTGIQDNPGHTPAKYSVAAYEADE
jgi:hypothetical protein